MRLLRSSSHAACSNLYDAIPLCPFSRSVGRWFDEKNWKDSEDKSWSWGRNCPEDCDSNWVSIYLLDSRIRPKQHTNCRRNDQLGLSYPIPIEWSWWRRERDMKGGHEAPVPSTKHHPERQRTARAAHDPRLGWAGLRLFLWIICSYAIQIYTVNPQKERLWMNLGKDVLKW